MAGRNKKSLLITDVKVENIADFDPVRLDFRHSLRGSAKAHTGSKSVACVWSVKRSYVPKNTRLLIFQSILVI